MAQPSHLYDPEKELRGETDFVSYDFSDSSKSTKFFNLNRLSLTRPNRKSQKYDGWSLRTKVLISLVVIVSFIIIIVLCVVLTKPKVTFKDDVLVSPSTQLYYHVHGGSGNRRRTNRLLSLREDIGSTKTQHFTTDSVTLVDVIFAVDSSINQVIAAVPKDGHIFQSTLSSNSHTDNVFNSTYPYITHNGIIFSGYFSVCTNTSESCYVNLFYINETDQYGLNICNGTLICDNYGYNETMPSTTILQSTTPPPTPHPTYTPTLSPSYSPTIQPSLSPTRTPTLIPTLVPTRVPTLIPTSAPTYSSAYMSLKLYVNDNNINKLAFNGTIKLFNNDQEVTAIFPDQYDITSLVSVNTTHNNDNIFNSYNTNKYVTSNGIAFKADATNFGGTSNSTFLYYLKANVPTIRIQELNKDYTITTQEIHQVTHRTYFQYIDYQMIGYDIDNNLICDVIFTIQESTTQVKAVYPNDGHMIGNTLSTYAFTNFDNLLRPTLNPEITTLGINFFTTQSNCDDVINGCLTNIYYDQDQDSYVYFFDDGHGTDAAMPRSSVTITLL